MLGTLGTLTNSGSMPIDAGGGAAAPSTANSSANNGFTVGSINMGSSSNKTLLIVGLTGIVALYLLNRKR